MKTLYSFLLLFIVNLIFAQNEFITIWKTDTTGTTDDNSFTYYAGSGNALNYNIYWEKLDNSSINGKIENITTQTQIVKTLTPGKYRVKVTGDFGIYINNQADKLKLKSVEQWGTHQWKSMRNAFHGCTNLKINASDAPNFSQCSDFYQMFYKCENLSGNFKNWTFLTSQSSFNNMFWLATNFNGDISTWKVDSVTNMSGMFNEASAFNSNISSWDVSKVENMEKMFFKGFAFNQDLSNWNVSKVTSMRSMFQLASKFNGNLSGWNVSNVTNIMNIFSQASAFESDLSEWNVSKIMNMTGMFLNASSFNSDLSNWNVSKATNMTNMFSGAKKFNSDLSNWDVDSVENMNGMFNGATSFDQDISNWIFHPNISFSNTFNRCGLSAKNWDKLLFSFDKQGLTDKDLNSSLHPKYCYSGIIHQNLKDKGWADNFGTRLRNPIDTTYISSGNDLYNCLDYSVLKIESDYFPVVWMTDGDGVLYNDTLKTPGDSSFYFPSMEERINNKQINVYAFVMLSDEYCTFNSDTLVINASEHTSVKVGNDTTITSGSLTLKGDVKDATEQVWSTTGNGTFTDPSALVTTYNPTPEDFDFGTVRLTLKSTNGVCDNKDDFLILGLKECNVTIDETVIENNTVILKASANNSKIIYSYEWDFGDGITGRANTVQHTYKNTGTYTVKVTGTSKDGTCTSSATKEITITDKNKEVYTASGTISVNSAPLDEGMVSVFYLSPEKRYELCTQTSISKVDNGQYFFPHLAEGEYYIMAYATENSEYFDKSLPSFYGNQISWNPDLANKLSLTSNQTDVNIELYTYTPINPPTTPSFFENNQRISEEFIPPTFSTTNYFTGLDIMRQNVLYKTQKELESGETIDLVDDIAPAFNAVILLRDKRHNFLGYTTTDKFGFFEFTNLQTGFYRLEIQPVGTSAITKNIVLDGNSNTISNYSFVVGGADIVTSDLNNNIEEDSQTLFYPNPATDNIYIDHSLHGKEYSIYTVEGTKVRDGIIESSLDITTLSNGIYLIKVDQKTLKFIK